MLVGLFSHGIGSSQLITVPKDSYLQDYYDDMSKYLHTGPPVYFVIKDGYDYANESNQNKVMFLLWLLNMVIVLFVFRSVLHLAVTVIQWVHRYLLHH